MPCTSFARFVARLNSIDVPDIGDPELGRAARLKPQRVKE